MANNQYVNKVQLANGTTLIDITDTTAVAGDVAAGKFFYDASGAKVEGTGSGGGGSEVLPLNVYDNGTYTAPAGKAYSPVVVNVPDSSELIYKDDEGYVVLSKHKIGKVRFLDYDGTVLYSFTKNDLDEMESLPENPSHSGLIAQGWNWSLADIKSYLTDYPNAYVNVGQMYITDDGKTRIYITLDDPDNLSPYLVINVYNGQARIDWGDGTEPDITSINSSSEKAIHHFYNTIGNYIITIEPINSTIGLFSPNTTVPGLLRIKDSGTYGEMGSLTYSTKVTKIEIGSYITQVYNYAFNKMYNLKSVTIPDSVTSIGTSAFYNCFSLQSVTIPDSVTSIGTSVFQNCYSLQSVAIPDGVTSLGNSAFSNCYSLASITIPDSVTSIVGSTFYNCYSLASITIPDSATSIGASIFYGCYLLQSVVIPDGITNIGNNSFCNCYSLQSVTIPDSVTSIGTSAFSNCYSLASITIPDSVTSIGSNAFQYCYLLQSLTIPDSVTSIGNSAFNSCYSLASITIPDGVTSIAGSVLANCFSLQSVTIPDSVTSIVGSAFTSCSSLQSLTIPDSVTSIGSGAFQNCFCLFEYHFKSVTPPSLANTNAFNGISSSTKIYVPYSEDHSILNAYQTASRWSTYASKMQEEPAP